MLTITELQDAANKNLSGMNLPLHKKDAAKPTTVVWLLRNLAAKNKEHSKFAETAALLLEIATQQHLLKRTELLDMQAALGEVALAEPVSALAHPEYFPHQIKVLNKVLASSPRVSEVPAGLGKGVLHAA